MKKLAEIYANGEYRGRFSDCETVIEVFDPVQPSTVLYRLERCDESQGEYWFKSVLAPDASTHYWREVTP